MDSVLLAIIAGLQVVLVLLSARFHSRARVPTWIDVSLKQPKGLLPGGSWEIAAGLGSEPVLPSGALVLDVRSTEVWVHEVWARTDHGWVQLQPGPGGGMFRNALVAGSRLSCLRLWLAPTGAPPDETELRAAAGLLVPAALLLTRATRNTPVPASRASPPPLT